MKFDVVIAHYKENIEWVRDIKHPSLGRVFLYTKGPVVPDMSDDRIVHSYLPNVGRESHTYLWHCVHNFRHISTIGGSDFTFFVQGSPHSMNAARMQEWMDEIESNSLPFTLNYRISSPYDFTNAGRVSSWAGSTHPAKFAVKEWCDNYVGHADFFHMPIFWNACFGVSNERIAASERDRLAHIQQSELSTLNPECGHFCERLWYHIFRMGDAECFSMPEGFWHFYGGPKGENHYGIMKLREDGQVRFYDNYNEKYWSKDGDSITFRDGKGNVDNEYSGVFAGAQKSTHRIRKTRATPVKK
jgi:hypothetical protein